LLHPHYELYRHYELHRLLNCHPERSEGSGCLLAAAIQVVHARTEIPHFARDDNGVLKVECFLSRTVTDGAFLNRLSSIMI